MDDHLDTFLAAQRAFGERVHAVREDQWRSGTPASEWSVADLVGHLVEEQLWAAALVHGMDMDAAGKIVEGSRDLPVDGGTGANFAEKWDEASAGSADAFSADGALDRSVTLSRGATPARDYVAELVVDLVVHAWDLGTAIGFAGEIPDRLVQVAYEQVEKMGDLSSSGVFDATVSVPDDAPTMDKLVARTGRDPRQGASSPS